MTLHTRCVVASPGPSWSDGGSGAIAGEAFFVLSTQEVERRKESPALAGLSVKGGKPSNVTFTIDDSKTSAAVALAM